MVIYDAIVIGAGVSGMTAAIYLKRAGLSVLVIEKSIPGGQINSTLEINNYPGFSSIDGPTLAGNMYKQLRGNDIEYKYGDVIDIKDGDIKKVITNKEEYSTRNIIIATGRIPRKLGIPKEDKYIGRGISWCATCDGFFYKDKDVALVGGGNSALTEALYLSPIVHHLYIIVRKDEFKADCDLIKQVESKKNITVLFKSVITDFEEKNNHLSGLILNENNKIAVEALFIYIGFNPNTKGLTSLNMKLSDDGYIVTDKGNRTSIAGVYACGDIVKKEYYQIATAIGDAATAALSLKEDFDKK